MGERLTGACVQSATGRTNHISTSLCDDAAYLGQREDPYNKEAL